ncbi:hypothetical protein BVRB_6g131540 isoform B [Beta vulgaris subsp. vulgaris]|nr:hypothetical protein BVRB_6g131540 isoform B [Beta vulgaris subsp. vulgaris]
MPSQLQKPKLLRASSISLALLKSQRMRRRLTRMRRKSCKLLWSRIMILDQQSVTKLFPMLCHGLLVKLLRMMRTLN